MSICPSRSTVIPAFFFLLIAGSKTLTNIGQACLTVDAMTSAVHCLMTERNITATIDNPDSETHISNICQIIAATFSTGMILLTRIPSIWRKLNNMFPVKSDAPFIDVFNGLETGKKLLLISIGLFGLLSCVSRGLSAYLGIVILLEDRWKIPRPNVIPLAILSAITATISCLCFNFSNMMTKAIDYCKNPTLNYQRKDIMPLMGTLSNAIAMRFFILHFLDRQHASNTIQMTGQVIFPLAEFIMGLFTMVASFGDDWKAQAKSNLKHSCLFTGLIAGDGLTTWLGYYTITWYSIFTVTSSPEPALWHNRTKVCPQNENTTDLAKHWTLLGVACLISIPATLSYFHYLLEYAIKNYKDIGEALKNRFISSEENSPLLINRNLT